MQVVKGPDNNAEEIISQLIWRYEKDLLRLCCAYLKDVSLAEDAVQETFLKAYNHLNTFRGESAERTWLVRIAINVCKDMRRSAWFRLARNAVTLDALQIATPEGGHEMRTALAAELAKLLKLQNVSLVGSHAKIHGALASYSVHLGSGIVHAEGIGMVSILPVHSQARGRIFLPFADDDPKTAEILSKILLLAEDRKLKDPTILAQLRR